MATRGTEFIGSELLKQVEANYDRRVQELCDEINAYNELTVAERHAAWRMYAEGAITRMAERLEHGDTVTDAELADFDIKSPPRPDEFKWAIQSREQQIDALHQAKAKALAYINALAAERGVVTLAAADLRRIGYQP